MTSQDKLKLIIDSDASNSDPLQYVIEEKTLNSPQKMFISGCYILVNERNKNGRIYDGLEMELEVDRYTREMIKEGRALGELNHPASAEVNLERACHKILELKREGNHYIGKSLVLNTPMGLLTKTLILDGVKVGVSTRCLGKLISEGFNTNKVVGARLVAVDTVADPSAPKAFVNGVLEAKAWIVQKDGTIQEAYDELESALSTLPKHDVNNYLVSEIRKFMEKLVTK